MSRGLCVKSKGWEWDQGTQMQHRRAKAQCGQTREMKGCVHATDVQIQAGSVPRLSSHQTPVILTRRQATGLCSKSQSELHPARSWVVKELGLAGCGEGDISQTTGIKGWLYNRLKLNWWRGWNLGKADSWYSEYTNGTCVPQ